MLNLNRESTFEEIIKHRVVVFNLFAVSNGTKDNKFDEMQLGKVLRDYLNNLDETDFGKSRLVDVFSIKNLEKQNMIVVNNDSDTFTFNQTFYDLFSYLSEDRYYKLNNHSLKKFTNTMKTFREELEKLNMNDTYATEQFIDMLMDEFTDIRQELDKHVRVLESKVNKLISIVEKKSEQEYLSNYELSKEIYKVNTYFVEPLKTFLLSDSIIDIRNSGVGITGYARKIRDKLSKEGYLTQSKEITAFLLNFSKSYLSRSLSMSTLLARYVVKSVEDIRIHANIEKLYLFLKEKSNDVAHGKKANRYLKSTDLLDKINFLPDLKSRESFNQTIDYESSLEGINIAWDKMHEEINEKEGKRDKIQTYFRELTEHEQELLKAEEFVSYGNGVLSEAKRNIMSQELTEDDDIFIICHNLLKEQMDNYKLFYSVLLVYSMEDELQYKMDFKQKRFINYGGEQLVYYRKIIGDEVHA
jgi:hypothetical protein